MEKCIYCSNPNGLTKSHIIPDCLGANLKLKKSVCKECNSKLGNTIEAKICNDFSFYRFLAQIKTKKRKSVINKAELEVMGKKITVKIGEGGVPKFVRPIIVEEGPPKKYLVIAESPSKLKKYVNGFEKMGIKFDPSKMGKKDIKLKFTADKRYIGSIDYKRVAAKIAFERLCYKSPLRAYSTDYDNVRNFIRFGKYQNEKPARLIFEAVLINKILPLPFPFHSILLFQFDRTIASIVSIFGLFYYFILLNNNVRIVQNWTDFIYFNPQTRESREPILGHDYSLRRIVFLINESPRGHEVVLRSQKFAKDKFDKVINKIMDESETS